MCRNASLGCSVLIWVCGAAIIAFTGATSANSISIDGPKTPLKVGREASTSVPSNVSARLPPQGFAFEVSGGTRPLNERGCFGVAISAFSDLAYSQLDSVSPAAKSYQLLQYPDIILNLAGPRGRGFTVKYMIWGLTTAMKYMVDYHEFQNWRFDLKWQRNLVGTIWFVYGGRREKIEGNYTAGFQNVTGSGLSTGFLRLKGRNNARVSFHWLSGSDLSFEEVMMVIIGGFTDLAVVDITQRVTGDRFVAVFPPYRTRFDLQLEPLSASLHGFSYEFVCSILLATAQFYLVQQTCKPVLVQAWIGQQFAATAELTNLDISPFDNEDAKAKRDMISKRASRRPNANRAL
ncbi:MAG: hypothetical protein Q9191_002243 [Dirinaria sp. TL-2023a]